jgi:hypothetical protein
MRPGEMYGGDAYNGMPPQGEGAVPGSPEEMGAPPPDPLSELARAIETQAQALTSLAEAAERSRLDLQTMLNSQVRIVPGPHMHHWMCR